MCFRIPKGFKSIAVGERLRRPRRIGEKIPDPERVKQSPTMRPLQGQAFSFAYPWASRNARPRLLT